MHDFLFPGPSNILDLGFVTYYVLASQASRCLVYSVTGFHTPNVTIAARVSLA